MTSTSSKIDLAAKKEKAYSRTFNIPERFKSKTLETFIGSAGVINAAKSAIIGKESLFITGSCGTGKTHLACGLMRLYFAENIYVGSSPLGNEELKFPQEPYFLPSVELFLELKATFDSKRETEESVIDDYSNINFLVIDDVGAEKVSDWSRQMFYTLIDRRYRNMKQTIITSNLTLDEIAQQIDGRISSRILEMGSAIKLDGSDRRKNK